MRSSAWALAKQFNGNAGGNTDPAPAGEDTVELELSAEQMLTLSRADTASRPRTLQAPPRENRLTNVPPHPPFAWASVILFVLVISGFSGGIAYLATAPTPPTQLVRLAANPIVQSASAAAKPPASPAAEDVQVRFTNPFDATEVFEFPSGTSETEARETVARVLLQRANDRQNPLKITRQRSKTAGQVAPDMPTRFARRS